MSSNINRPPTPDPDDGVKEFTLEEKIRIQLVSSGEYDRLKSKLRQRLEDCGWKDHIKELCEEYVKSNGREKVTAEEIVRAVRPEGRSLVPDSVKAELLTSIRAFITNL